MQQTAGRELVPSQAESSCPPLSFADCIQAVQCIMPYQQVCVQLPTSAVNMALPQFAAASYEEGLFT